MVARMNKSFTQNNSLKKQQSGRLMKEFERLSTELITLNKFIKQRSHDAKKEHANPEHLRMVSPPYERELIAVSRIPELIRRIYQDEQA